jgi:uncharacterized protein
MKGPIVHARPILLASVLLLPLLALSACGGASTTASGSSPASSGEASPAASPSPSPSWSPTAAPVSIPVIKPGQKLPPWSQIKAMYEYDPSEPLALTWVPNLDVTESGVKLRGLTFQSGGETEGAFLALPEGQGPFPVVVYAPGHGSGGVLVDWSRDAAKLAKKGYAGLLLEETTGPFWTWDGLTDVEAYVAYVRQEQRGLDLLETMPEIDPTRIGFVGWSAGAILGGMLSGLDPRIKAFVLDGMDTGGLVNWGAADRAQMKSQGISPQAYGAQMSLIDPTAYLKHSSGSPFLFIWGKAAGEIATPGMQKRFVAAAGPHATVFMQPGGHWISPQASRFLEAWIVKNL